MIGESKKIWQEYKSSDFINFSTSGIKFNKLNYCDFFSNSYQMIFCNRKELTFQSTLDAGNEMLSFTNAFFSLIYI